MAVAFDEIGFHQRLQMVRERARRKVVFLENFPAIHVGLGRDRPVDLEPGGIGQGFGDFRDLGGVHGTLRF